MGNKTNPRYYKWLEAEPIEIMMHALTLNEFIGFLKGNIIKYSLRAGFKSDEVENDLSKRNWYQRFFKGIALSLDVDGLDIQNVEKSFLEDKFERVAYLSEILKEFRELK